VAGAGFVQPFNTNCTNVQNQSPELSSSGLYECSIYLYNRTNTTSAPHTQG
jgi:hypothetical protein